MEIPFPTPAQRELHSPPPPTAPMAPSKKVMQHIISILLSVFPINYPGIPRGLTREQVIQQHVSYWDRDKDSIIWPRDTYTGCRDFGWSRLLAFFASLIIHLGLSYSTVPNLILPDPYFRIYVDRLYKAKHGSDSMTFDSQGRFRPQQFEDIFAKYDQGGKGGLDVDDLCIFWKDQRMLFDFFGWTACALEWVATYLLIWPADGILKKEDIRTVYDGSIFYKRAEETRRKRADTISDFLANFLTRDAEEEDPQVPE
ncbi:MAG: hypothetical protein Q9212_007222 [Teloschistes hypoglaucus]